MSPRGWHGRKACKLPPRGLLWALGTSPLWAGPVTPGACPALAQTPGAGFQGPHSDAEEQQEKAGLQGTLDPPHTPLMETGDTNVAPHPKACGWI